MGKVINLFPNQPKDIPLEEQIQHFLNILDKSLDSFFEYSPHEKFALYQSLVSFTHTSMEVYLESRNKGEKVE